MKKILLSIALCTLFISNADAQRNHRNPYLTSIKGGANMSTLSGGNTQEFKPGFQIGGTVEIPLSFYKKLSVQTELMYSVQGYTGAEYDQIDFETSKVIDTKKLEDVTMHYLYVPIVFKYYVSDNFSVELGGQVGYMLDAKGQFDMNKYNTAREYLSYSDPKFNATYSQLDQTLFEAGYRDKNYENYYEKLDFGVNAGFSYYMQNGVYVNFRYYMGLQDVYKIDNDYQKIAVPTNPIHPDLPAIPEEAYQELLKEVKYANDNLKFDPLKNSTIQISVGYQF